MCRSKILIRRKSGVGLRGMRERICQFEGAWRFIRPPGTHIVAILTAVSSGRYRGKGDSHGRGVCDALRKRRDASPLSTATILCIDDEATGCWRGGCCWNPPVIASSRRARARKVSSAFQSETS